MSDMDFPETVMVWSLVLVLLALAAITVMFALTFLYVRDIWRAMVPRNTHGRPRDKGDMRAGRPPESAPAPMPNRNLTVGSGPRQRPHADVDLVPFGGPPYPPAPADAYAPARARRPIRGS